MAEALVDRIRAIPNGCSMHAFTRVITAKSSNSLNKGSDKGSNPLGGHI